MPFRPIKSAVCVAALAVGLVAVGAGNRSLTAQNTAQALRRAEQTYRSIETLSAHFVQTLENPMLGDPAVSTGTLYLAPPSQFAMRFEEPEGDRIVCDGTWLWIYLPSSVPNQVFRQPIPKRGAATPNLFAQFVERPLERYRASFIADDNVAGIVVDVVRLVPRRDDDPFAEVEVSIARATGLVRRLVIQEPAGQKRTMVFDRIHVDEAIPDARFEFVVPEGARVIVP